MELKSPLRSLKKNRISLEGEQNMNDIINLMFDLVQKINPLQIFVIIPLCVAAGCIVLMIILKIAELVKKSGNKKA